MTVSKADLIEVLSGAIGASKEGAARALDAVLKEIVTRTERGEKVIIRGFGTFEMKTRAARTGRNPGTGLPVEIAASTTLTFKAAKPKT